MDPQNPKVYITCAKCGRSPEFRSLEETGPEFYRYRLRCHGAETELKIPRSELYPSLEAHVTAFDQ